MIKGFYFWIFFLHLSTTLSAEVSWTVNTPKGFSAKALISKNELQLPEPLIVELTLSFPAGYHADEKILLAHLLRNPRPGIAPFLLLSVNKETLSAQENLQVEKWTYRLEPQIPGLFGITFFNIPFLSDIAGQKVVELPSELLNVKVILPEVKKGVVLPVEAPLNLSNTFPIDMNSGLKASLHQKLLEQGAARNLSQWEAKRFPWEVFLILTILLFCGLYFKFAPRKHPKKDLEMLSTQNYLEAEEMLQDLEHQPEMDPLLAKAYIAKLSKAVRSKIEEKYNLNVLPDTTEEFFAQVGNVLEESQLAQLKEFISLADQVKFAAYIPTIQECHSAKSLAENLLNNKLL